MKETLALFFSGEKITDLYILQEDISTHHYYSVFNHLTSPLSSPVLFTFQYFWSDKVLYQRQVPDLLAKPSDLTANAQSIFCRTLVPGAKNSILFIFGGLRSHTTKYKS